MSPSRQVDRLAVAGSCKCNTLNSKKEHTTDSLSDVATSVMWNKASGHSRVQNVSSHFCEIPEQTKLIYVDRNDKVVAVEGEGRADWNQA